MEEPVSTRMDNMDFPMWAVINIEEGVTSMGGPEGRKGGDTDG